MLILIVYINLNIAILKLNSNLCVRVNDLCFADSVTFKVSNLMSILRCLLRPKLQVQIRSSLCHFITSKVCKVRSCEPLFPNIQLETRLECMYLSNTTLLDGRDMYRMYYIKNNYMFRHLTMTISVWEIKKKLSKQLYSTYVGCIQLGGQRWSGYDISYVLCRMGGVGTWGFCYCMLF